MLKLSNRLDELRELVGVRRFLGLGLPFVNDVSDSCITHQLRANTYGQFFLSNLIALQFLT